LPPGDGFGAEKASSLAAQATFYAFERPRLAGRPSSHVHSARAGDSDATAEAASTSKLSLSANLALTTDYIFRGFSQTDEGPAIQGGFELGYKNFYLGVWGSNVNFGGAYNQAGDTQDLAYLEIDWYGGIKPVWKGITFDIGAYYYTYPDSLGFAHLDYVEAKTGASYTFFDKLTLGLANWWTPQNYGETGRNDVLEFSGSYALNKIWIFTPTISALVGRQWGEETKGGFDYTYWNAGVILGFNETPAFTLDVRYWDTNIPGCSAAVIFQCDQRVIATLQTVF
jgi:uncharacterized protein (TIGR02001 family)